MSFDVAIVGGGPAGLMAAQRAAARGRRAILLDKNREPGVKILLSGGTRCNLTHAADARGIVAAFGPAGRFLHSALAALGPEQLVDLFAAEGVPTKVEPGGKVFPASDRAADVRAALLRRVRQSGCTLALGEPLVELARDGDGFRLSTPRQSLHAGKVVLATGGKSYPACGTTGDGYRWAAALGHAIVAPHEALVPVTSHAAWVRALQGVTLPDVVVHVMDVPLLRRSSAERDPMPSTACKQAVAHQEDDGGDGIVSQPADKNVCPTDKNVRPTVLAASRGAMLFAHFGVTGPAVLDVSHAVSGLPNPNAALLRCDMAPAMTEDQLDAEMARVISASGKRRTAALLDDWLPRRVGETLLELLEIPPDRTLAELSKPNRRRLARAVKRLDIPASGTMGFRKAEVTAGGVALDEVDSRTMQSRLVPDLYFAGELLDLHGPIGGYNFQAAFSTGWLAGENA